MKAVPGGLCYVLLFRPAHVESVGALGPKATIASIRRYVNANAGCLNNAFYKLSLNLDEEGVVGHVELSDVEGVGVSAEALIAACSKTLRLGSAGTVAVVRDSTATEVSTSNHPRLELNVGGAGHRVQLPLGGYLNHDLNYMGLELANIPGFRRTMSLFESVKLLNLTLTVTVQGNVSTVCRVAMTGSRIPPNENGGWATAEGSMTLVGNSQGATINEFNLPPGHRFGRELKAVALGNEPPSMHFYVTSAVPCHVWFRGLLEFELNGQGNPKGIDISNRAGKMGSLHPQCVITSGFGAAVVSADSDDEEEEEPAGSPRQGTVSPTHSRTSATGSNAGGSGKVSQVIRR